MRYCFLFFVLLLFLFPALSFGETTSGMVKHVYDGDTFLLVSRTDGKMRVRLYGIDAPELQAQPYGTVSKRVLMYKLLGKTVKVDIRDKDKYGRIVGVVKQGNRDINADMVREGMAWAYRQYLDGAYASEYIALEQQARKYRVGLWRQANPQPPWEFRHTGKAKRHRR